MTDLFASHQKMITLEPLNKRTIHGHNCLQRSVSDDDDCRMREGAAQLYIDFHYRVSYRGYSNPRQHIIDKVNKAYSVIGIICYRYNLFLWPLNPANGFHLTVMFTLSFIFTSFINVSVCE